MKTGLNHGLALILLMGVLAIPFAQEANALLIVQGPGGGGFGGYDYPGYHVYTDRLNSTFGVANIVLTPDLSNLAQMLQHDALVIELRNSTDQLSSIEQSNLTAYIATGRRLVIFGENTGWTTWNNSFLGVLGSSSLGSTTLPSANGHMAVALTHELTASILSENNLPEIYMMHGSVADGGSALFEENFATLWGTDLNVLTILDNNLFDSGVVGAHPGTSQFLTNIDNWLFTSKPNDPMVPEPSTILLVGLGLMGWGSWVRQKKNSDK